MWCQARILPAAAAGAFAQDGVIVIEDFVAAVAPRRAALEARFNPRGGIETVVRCAWEPKKRPRGA